MSAATGQWERMSGKCIKRCSGSDEGLAGVRQKLAGDSPGGGRVTALRDLILSLQLGSKQTSQTRVLMKWKSQKESEKQVSM